jgi:hypothetical protein
MWAVILTKELWKKRVWWIASIFSNFNNLSVLGVTLNLFQSLPKRVFILLQKYRAPHSISFSEVKKRKKTKMKTRFVGLLHDNFEKLTTVSRQSTSKP